ncbi:MAG TPA: SDR family NAD(P)-dependent oxidoreductase, partial [Sphingobium sp.]
MDLQLTGKRAIVTGGSRGIGRAIARALLDEGVQVVIAARDEAALTEAATTLAQQTGGKVIGIAADTRSDEDGNALVERAAQWLGGIDIL